MSCLDAILYGLYISTQNAPDFTHVRSTFNLDSARELCQVLIRLSSERFRAYLASHGHLASIIPRLLIDGCNGCNYAEK